MKYFKNTELAGIFGVSEKSVRNWVQATIDGKLDLDLEVVGGRSYVANTSRNNALITTLVEKGQKYKNTRGARTIHPLPDFYKHYDRKQILDIISNLVVHKEIPLQYGYADGGAASWDMYVQRLSDDTGPNILTETKSLIDTVMANMDGLNDGGDKKFNVIDLGAGNGQPLKHLLAELIARNKLGRYVAVDVNNDMLDVLEKNIRAWFGDKIRFERHVRDLNYERFDDLLDDEGEVDSTTNLVFLLGGTYCNFRVPQQLLHVINQSMGLGDILFTSGYLDTQHTRRHFDYKRPSTSPKSVTTSLILPGLLNIDESMRDIESFFDEQYRARVTLLRPKIDLSIHFRLGERVRRVELRKGESILIWRHRHYTAVGMIDLFDENGFDLLQAIKSKNQDYILTLHKIKVGLDSHLS